MFTKMMTLLITLMIVVQASASTTRSGLQEAFEELNYSLTVEWDQEDQEFYEQKTKAFAATIVELQKQGLTNGELIDESLMNLKNKKAADEIKALLSNVDKNNLTFQQTKQLIQTIFEKSQQQGAAWISEDVAATIWMSFLGVALVTAIIWTAIDSKGHGTSPVKDNTCAHTANGVCVDGYDDPWEN